MAAIFLLIILFYNCGILIQISWIFFPHGSSSTHWGRVTHIYVSKIIIIGSDNGLLLGRRQAIIWTNAEILLIGPLGINFSDILIEINILFIQGNAFENVVYKKASISSQPQWVNNNLAPGSGLALNRWLVTIWTNDGPVYWHICVTRQYSTYASFYICITVDITIACSTVRSLLAQQLCRSNFFGQQEYGWKPRKISSVKFTQRATWKCTCRAESRLAPSQWETSLQSNAVSHWLGAHLESAQLCTCILTISQISAWYQGNFCTKEHAWIQLTSKCLT